MSAKKKTKKVQADVMDSAHKIWLAGLGAFAMAEQEGGKLFKSLMEKGEGVEKSGKEQVEEQVGKAKGTVAGLKTVAESYWDTFERTIDDQMTAVIHRVGVPTKGEIESLTKKVEELTVSVDNMRAKPAVKKTTTAAKRTTAAKKTTAAAKKTTATAKKATAPKPKTTTTK